jgi:RNA-binding protein
MSLTNPQIRHLKALAQHLEPVLHLGKNGMSEAFLKSLDEALARHELVKVKFSAFKEEKKELSPIIAEKSGSHLITRVGNVLVLFREQPNPSLRQIRFD